MAGPTCHIHPSSEATGTCVRCLKPICSVCEVIHGMQTLCPPCVGKARQARLVRTVVVALLVAGVLGGGLYLLWDPVSRVLRKKQEQASAKKLVDWGKYTAEIVKLEEHLANEPCDRPKMQKLSSTLYRAGDHRGVIRRVDTFIKRCGAFNRLLWTTYESHKRLSEWKEAVADATTLIEDDPYDKDFRWWRGIAYEQMGQLEKAAEDYRQSISLMPNLKSIPFNLADVLEKLDRPCEAILPLEQFLHYYPNTRGRDRIRARIEGLHGHERCSGLGAEGRTVVRRVKGEKVFVAAVSVNGGRPGRFIVDTGASYLSMARPFAEANGLKPSGGQEVLLRTASGVKKGTLITVDRVKVGQVNASRVAAAVTESLGKEVDGLLGLSFLSRFEVTLDHGGGRLVIAAR